MKLSLDEGLATKRRAEVWWGVQPRLLWVYEADFDTSFPVRRPMRSPFKLWYIIEGKAVVRIGHKEVVVQPGHWLFPGVPFAVHEICAHSRMLSLALHFPASALRPTLAPQVLYRTKVPHLHKTVQSLLAWTGAHGEPLMRGRPMDIEPLTYAAFSELQTGLMRVMAILLQIFPDFLPGEDDPALDSRLHLALHFIKNGLHSSILDHRRICSATGISWRRLEQLFKEELKISPQAYLQRLRVDEAAKRLAETQEPIKGIALDLGFYDLSHFSSWFKKAMDVSPRTYREQVHSLGRFQARQVAST